MSSMEVAAAVQGLVSESKQVLSRGVDSEAMVQALGIMQHLLPGGTKTDLPDALRSLDLRASQEEFLRCHYSGWLRFLLQHYTVEWVGTLGRGRVLTAYDPFFLKGSHHEAFCVLGYGLGQYSHFQALRCAELLEHFLKQCLGPMLKSQCQRQRITPSHPLWQQLLVLLASLPERVTGVLRAETSAVFYPDAYVSQLSREFLATLTHLEQQLQASQDCSVEFLGQLLGKLCMAGHGARIWKHLLRLLGLYASSNYRWSRLCEQMMSSVPDSTLESTLVPLIQGCASGLVLSRFIGNSVLTRQKLNFLFTQKFLFIRHYPKDHFLQVLMGYLASSASMKPLLLQTVVRLVSVWGDKSSLKHTSYEQHFYLSRAIMVSLAFLSNKDKLQLKEDSLKSLMVGVQAHLDSSSPAVRRLGMVVAEALTNCTTQDDQPQLKFEYEENEEVLRLKSLLQPPSVDEEEFLSPLFEQDLRLSDPEDVPSVGTGPAAAASQEGHASDLDSDDDLEPYDLSNDVKISKVKKPVYLRDCMNGLLNSAESEQVEICLQSAESLIRRHATSAKEVAVEFTKILLHLENQTCLEDFLHCRHGAMVALACVNPTKVADYLTGQFYDRNFNIRQRIDILHVLASAGQELSDPKSKSRPASSASLPVSALHPSITLATDEEQPDWRRVVQDRIDRKTRRFGKGRTQPEAVAVVSQFAPVAGHFIFPLLRDFDKQELTFDLLGTDHLLLSQLLYTLGSLMYSALNAPAATQIGITLLEFLWVFRYHPQPAVRQAVLYAASMVLLAVPSHCLMTDLNSQVLELKEWLQGVVERDMDEECQQRGMQALLVLQRELAKELEASPS